MGRRNRPLSPEVLKEIREAIEKGKAEVAAGIVPVMMPSHSTPASGHTTARDETLTGESEPKPVEATG